MNVVFCVYRSWNLRILEGLIHEQGNAAWRVSLVLAPNGMKLQAFEGVETMHIDPQSLGEYKDRICSEEPSVIIAYGWSWIIPRAILDIAPCLVLHPSPLPKYRGGSPIQNQLLDGITESAVSIIRAGERLDAGDILAQEPISFEGYLEEIVDRMSEVGLRLTKGLLARMEAGQLRGVSQDDTQATVVKRRTPRMSEITLEEIQNRGAEYLYNKIRGLQDPYPEAYIVCGDGKKLYVTQAHLEEV